MSWKRVTGSSLRKNQKELEVTAGSWLQPGVVILRLQVKLAIVIYLLAKLASPADVLTGSSRVPASRSL